MLLTIFAENRAQKERNRELLKMDRPVDAGVVFFTTI